MIEVIEGAVKWLLGPVGRYLLIVLAFVAWTAYQRHDAAESARAECQSAQLQKTLTEIKRQNNVLQQAVDESEKQSAVRDSEIAVLEKEKDAISASVGEAGKSPCVVPLPAVKRMRDIK